MRLQSIRIGIFGAALLLLSFHSTAFAEVDAITVARPYGMSTLPLIVMQHDKLFEKYAKEEGLGEIKVTWTVFAGASQLIDAMLAGKVDFVGQGFTSYLLLWSKTGGQQIRSFGSLGSLPMILVTREARIKTIKDFTDKDRITVPGVNVSPQAIVLQMAAGQAFGKDQTRKLDRLTITRSQPDAMVSVLSGQGEINSAFSTAPFEYEMLAKPGIHQVLNSVDVVGPATLNVAYTTVKFRHDNPRIYTAFRKGLEEATRIINTEKAHTVDAYIAVSHDKTSKDELLRILNEPQMHYTTTPQGTMKYADFMHEQGLIKTTPKSWKDLFFEELHGLPGS